MSPLLTPQSAQLTFVNPELTCVNGRISRINRGPRRLLQQPRGVADLREQIDMTEVTPACAKATAKFPQGRTGTPAGYAAHRKNGETACEACLAAWNLKCIEQKRAAAPEDRERWNNASKAAEKLRRAERRACVPGGLKGTGAGHAAHLAAGQYPCPPCRQAALIPGLACARPTLGSPGGRTGTPTGYQAHRDADEQPCEPCVKAQTEKSNARRRSLSGEELERYRRGIADASRRRRERSPEAVRATKHRLLAKTRAAVHAAKSKPCADCGVQYPYYVMEFDHLDADSKEFNVSAGVTSKSFARLMAEIAKCEVVCANCHAERTHQRKQARKGAQADAI